MKKEVKSNDDFLIKYLSTDSPSTFEVEAQVVWKEEVSKYSDEVLSDNYGNTVAIVKNKFNNQFKIALDAHCDEIGWMISSISDEGYIRIKRNGGTDNYITPTTKVKILTRSGNKISGVFGVTPIHLKSHDKEPEKIKEDDLYIDVFSSSKDEVKNKGINIGDYVVVDRLPEIINDGKYIIGKSLDDKIGGYITAEVLKKIQEDNIKLSYELCAINSVQEEVGLRGAKMITETIKPNIAISFDVHFDTNTPGIDKIKEGDTKLNGGLVFRKGADVHPKLFNFMLDIADKYKFPYTIVVGGAGGTNTTAYNLSNGGIVTASLSIPLRYMHTPNEIVSLSDVNNAIDYIYKLLLELDTNQTFKLI